MNRLIIVSSVLLLSVGAFADTETIEPTGLGSPAQWASSNADSHADNVTDGIDGEYVVEITPSQDIVFTLSNTTFAASATVDSFIINWRGQDNGSGNNKVQAIAYTDASNYCLGANVALTTSWVDRTESFTAAPSGADACAGSLTKSVMDAMQVRLDCTGLGIGKEVRVTEISVTVYYTPAPPVTRASLNGSDRNGAQR